eukprot:Rhum_TRINITY_DN11659_c0_g1::Rhum_TRINITY_DN11659_c0_g1_i1::g.46024::m.46024
MSSVLTCSFLPLQAVARTILLHDAVVFRPQERRRQHALVHRLKLRRLTRRCVECQRVQEALRRVQQPPLLGGHPHGVRQQRAAPHQDRRRLLVLRHVAQRSKVRLDVLRRLRNRGRRKLRQPHVRPPHRGQEPVVHERRRQAEREEVRALTLPPPHSRTLLRRGHPPCLQRRRAVQHEEEARSVRLGRRRLSALRQALGRHKRAQRLQQQRPRVPRRHDGRRRVQRLLRGCCGVGVGVGVAAHPHLSGPLRRRDAQRVEHCRSPVEASDPAPRGVLEQHVEGEGVGLHAGPRHLRVDGDCALRAALRAPLFAAVAAAPHEGAQHGVVRLDVAVDSVQPAVHEAAVEVHQTLLLTLSEQQACGGGGVLAAAHRRRCCPPRPERPQHPVHALDRRRDAAPQHLVEAVRYVQGVARDAGPEHAHAAHAGRMVLERVGEAAAHLLAGGGAGEDARELRVLQLARTHVAVLEQVCEVPEEEVRLRSLWVRHQCVDVPLVHVQRHEGVEERAHELGGTRGGPDGARTLVVRPQRGGDADAVVREAALLVAGEDVGGAEDVDDFVDGGDGVADEGQASDARRVVVVLEGHATVVDVAVVRLREHRQVLAAAQPSAERACALVVVEVLRALPEDLVPRVLVLVLELVVAPVLRRKRVVRRRRRRRRCAACLLGVDGDARGRCGGGGGHPCGVAKTPPHVVCCVGTAPHAASSSSTPPRPFPSNEVQIL